MEERVVIVGGGLAGLAAAVRLAEHDVPVTLVETSKRLGGRATSFTDPASGETLDNCQHVLLRACTNLQDFYERLGVADRIDWHRTMHFGDLQGRRDALRGDDLPAPLHLLRPMLAFKTLTAGEKFAVMRGMLGVLQVSRRGRAHHANETFLDWLAHHRQPEGAIRKFWSVICISACNERPDRVAASYALQVFQEGLLYDTQSYEMGVPNVPLRELYDPAQQQLERAGGELLFGASADEFLYDSAERRITYLRLSDRQELTGSAFISAVPPDRLSKIVPDELRGADGRLQHLDQIEASPILGIHLFFRASDAAPVMDEPHLALMDGQVQWVFNKGFGALSAGSEPGQSQSGAVNGHVQHLHVVISAAHNLVDLPADQLVSTAVSELRQALPATRDAELLHSRVLKEKRATFSARPGIDALRPSVEPDDSGARNLYVAGDWVQTDWPATMESAVRSGYQAAAAVLRDRGSHAAGLPVEDVSPSPLYRLLSG